MSGTLVQAQSAEELQESIKLKQQRIEELQRQVKTYEAGLEQKRRERQSLGNEISILTDRIAKTALDIETTKAVIEKTNLEIKSLETLIEKRESELVDLKTELGGLVRWYDRARDRDLLRILFAHSSFADFYDELKTLRVVQANLLRLVSEVEEIKLQLSEAKKSLEEKRQELVKQAAELDKQRLAIEGQQETKEYLLTQTRSSEKRFAAMLEEARRESERTSQEISSLEKSVRERLRQEGVSTDGDRPTIIWPLPNTRGISSVFHDPDYPFRRVFEHSGIDIRAGQGTPVRAAASGYVAKAASGGTRGYGYVMIIHDGSMATVYGHVSKLQVKQDSYVAQGEVIALSGGLPGTPGAGPFTTGPHLHFETRLSGIPVDPLPMLP